MQYRKNRKTGKTFPLGKETKALDRKLLEANRALLLEQENQIKSLQKLQREEISAQKKIGSKVEAVALALKQKEARTAQKRKHTEARTAQRKKGGQQKKALKKKQEYSHVWSGFKTYERDKTGKWGA